MAFNSRWLSTTKSRLGKLFFHGCQTSETRAAGELLKKLTENWREYVAGSEGFLTGTTSHGGKGHGPGLFRREVVWGDEDVMVCHVNNVCYVKWAESARVNWVRNIGVHADPANRTNWENTVTNQGIGLILASIKIDYKFPVQFPDKVSVYHKISKDLGTHNFALDVMVLSEKEQRIAARCHEDIVTYNYVEGAKAPIPEFMRTMFEDIMRLQKETAQDAADEMREIEKKVGELERSVLERAEMK